MKIIFISCDTLRADHLGAYGHPRPTSPFLDQFAKDGVLFEQAIAGDIPTEAAHTAIFTGRLGVTSGVIAHGSPATSLPKETPWLPSILWQAGMTTAAVDNLFNLKEWFGRGYRYYINSKSDTRWIDGATVNKFALPWLREHASEDFFLFLHYWDAHTPYLPPKHLVDKFYQGDPFDPKHRSMDPVKRQPVYPFFKEFHYDLLGPVTDAAYINALYEAEILYLDGLLRELDDELGKLGIREETLVVLFGDHGESLYEHDWYWDHAGLYDANVHIPLIMRWPERLPEGVRIAPQVQHVDIFPTVLELLGLPPVAGIDGQSLLPLIRGEEKTERYPYVFLSECGWNAARGVRTPEWKLIKNIASVHWPKPPLELYNLTEDPGETRDVAADYPDIAAKLEAKLLRWVDDKLGHRPDPMKEVLSTHGLPAEARMDRTLRKWGLSWQEWLNHPDMARLEDKM